MGIDYDSNFDYNDFIDDNRDQVMSELMTDYIEYSSLEPDGLEEYDYFLSQREIQLE